MAGLGKQLEPVVLVNTKNFVATLFVMIFYPLLFGRSS